MKVWRAACDLLPGEMWRGVRCCLPMLNPNYVEQNIASLEHSEPESRWLNEVD